MITESAIADLILLAIAFVACAAVLSVPLTLICMAWEYFFPPYRGGSHD